MSVGFGFSAGDFISALELVATVVDALRESGLARTEYRGLVDQLELLRTALHEVNNVELDDCQYAEKAALQQAAAQCQRTIDGFWRKNIQKYEPSLRDGGSGFKFKDGWMKIKWALCQKEELAKFKADLVGNTESINLILATVQMEATRIQRSKSDQNHKSLVGKVQGSYFGCMQRMKVVLELATTGIRQGKQLLEMTAQVMQTNVNIFQLVLNIHNIITQIPGQVDRKHPVYFIDAMGRNMSFDLEFVMSADVRTHTSWQDLSDRLPKALKSVLRCNFRNIGSGAMKIEKGEFVIQDSATNKDIDLASPWETCFYPKQHVTMSMVFNSPKLIMHCPKCSADNEAHDDEDIECDQCHMIYRRSVTLESIESKQIPSLPATEPSSFIRIEPHDFPTLLHMAGKSSQLKRKRSDDEEEEMALFRRVRIKTSIFLPAKDSRPGSPASTGSVHGVPPASRWSDVAGDDDYVSEGVSSPASMDEEVFEPDSTFTSDSPSYPPYGNGAVILPLISDQLEDPYGCHNADGSPYIIVPQSPISQIYHQASL